MVDKVTTKINLNNYLRFNKLDEEDQDQAVKRVANYLKEQVLTDVGNARSPISGKKFPGLNPKYKKLKSKKAKPIANLELTGDMLASFKYEIKGNEIELGIFGGEADKADGHCNHSGASKLPNRRFIPKDEKFRKGIEDNVKRIIKEIHDG